MRPGWRGHDALIDRTEANFEALGYGLWALEVKETGQFARVTGDGASPLSTK